MTGPKAHSSWPCLRRLSLLKRRCQKGVTYLQTWYMQAPEPKMALNFHVQAAMLSSGILNGPKLLGLLHHVNISYDISRYVASGRLSLQ